MLQAHPSVGVTVTICGCAYLCWLGISLIRAGERTETQNDGAPGGLPARPLGVFAFQFMNPKGWVMMLTATATGLTFAHLAPLVTAIPLGCLLAWSMLGSTLRQQLERGAFRKAFERAMGALLIGSALFLLL